VLIIGFGGLLLMMASAGMDALQALQRIQDSNDRLREDFVLRNRVLERIRADLYVSGTYVRDYLLEPEAGRAEDHRDRLLTTRKDMDAAIGAYRTIVNAENSQPFQALTRELSAYWQVLDPVFRWTTTMRRRDGYAFLRDEVFPRRTSMLAMADGIAEISESQLKAGRLTVEEAYRQFHRRLLFTIGLTVGFGLLLASFSVGITLRFERETAEHYREMASARGELRRLSARLVEVQENERRSIARELHDEVGQALTGVLVEMANLSTLLRANHPHAVEKAEEIKRLIESSINVVRNMALLLRPSMLDDLGLVPALQWQARDVIRRTGIWAVVEAGQVSEELPEEHKTGIYRIVQEGLHNVVRHARARSVKISVEQQPAQLLLSIADDGRGFKAPGEKGMGLLGIQERVSNLGGTFAVESEPGRGTTLRVVLPLPEARSQGATGTA
jgi:signal transduction histidine kinase